jgi:glycosyltransferase involved in cell wall biosynthesis
VTFVNGELRDLLSDKVKLIVLEKKSYFNTAKRLKNILEKENINFVNASLFSAMIISCLAAKKKNIPVIWYFHSHEYDIQFKSRIALKYFSKYGCLKKILFVSSELKESMKNKGFNFPENKQDVLYNTYTVNADEESGVKNKGSLTIGFLGRLAGLKRVDYIIELAVYLKNKSINNFQINIAGDGECRNDLIEYSKKSGVSDKINFLGFQSDVNGQYESFDIFVLPSKEECLSVALIDACAKGLPCVAFDVGGNNEIITNNKSGYLVNNKEEFFDKVKLLTVDTEKRKELGSEARINCIAKFNTKKRIDYLEKIFRN